MTYLQGLTLRTIHMNQYGFTKGWTIQNCLSGTFQYLHLCHQSNREIVILKLCFEKAFNMVEHHMIQSMFQKEGFSARWQSWMKQILCYGNIYYTSEWCSREGVSPLLFCLCGGSIAVHNQQNLPMRVVVIAFGFGFQSGLSNCPIRWWYFAHHAYISFTILFSNWHPHIICRLHRFESQLP